ncbi:MULTISPECIES: porin family protein [unclassified Lysobacter]|uniref:porin family protein n=1 Tax=unclassified Lysobacter TaxID=2635362 RepID=UPI001C23C8D3|nr:porin family protein [Lysobacter sp. MMG2]MBU8974574.1 porin family protein [Lysobacter sp. MMG2]
MNTRIALPLAVLLAMTSMQARAIEPLDTFSARIGGYITEFDTEVRADGETESGTRIDLQRDLGLDESNTVAVVGVTWRPFDNHEFGLSYYQDDASASRTTNRSITFEDTTFEAQSTLRAEVDLDAYDLYYVWWGVNNDRWALGPRVGLVWYRMNLELSLQVDAQGNRIDGAIREDVDADLPAPSIGGSWRWAPLDDWRFSADVGYFSADIDNIDADITFGRLGVEWFPWERAGLSLDYTVRRIEADSRRDDFIGNLDFTDSGIRLGAVYRF